MNIIAITVSVNYSEILEAIIAQNMKFLYKWFIVTEKSDTKTIQLLEEYKNHNDVIQILLYDGFYTNKCTFNKGGAIKFAQDYIDTHFTESNILILDSDIYLPNNFKDSLPPIIRPKALYGVANRYDYWSMDDFINGSNPHKYKHGNKFVGFFQLYKQSSIHTYKDSVNCGKCDDDFRDLFNIRYTLNLSVKHLGKEGVNWNGRFDDTKL